MDELSDMTPEQALKIVSGHINKLRTGLAGRRRSLGALAQTASLKLGREITVDLVWKLERRDVSAFTDADVLDVGRVLGAFGDEEKKKAATKPGKEPSDKGGLAARILALRKRRGLTRKEVCDLSGGALNLSFLYNIELPGKKTRPSAEKLQALADVLGVTPRYLATGTDQVEKAESQALSEVILSLKEEYKAVLIAVVNVLKTASQPTEQIKEENTEQE